MKKYLFCLVLFVSLGFTGYSQNIDQLLKKAEMTESVDKIKISGFLMSLGKMAGGINNIPVAKGVKSMEIYSLSDCRHSIKKEFSDLFYNLNDGNGYETLVYAKDGNEGVRILINKKKDTIHNTILLCMDKNDPAIIKFSGKIKEKDIAGLVNNTNI